jgi:hypothetical protein
MDTKDEIGLRRKSIKIIYQCFLIYSCLFCDQNSDLTFYHSQSKYTVHVVCWYQGIFTTIQFQTRSATRSDVTDARDAENQLDNCVAKTVKKGRQLSPACLAGHSKLCSHTHSSHSHHIVASSFQDFSASTQYNTNSAAGGK